MQWIVSPVVMMSLLATPMVAFAQEFNVYDPYGQSFDTDYTSPTWQPSVPSTGGGSSGGSAGSAGGTAGGGTGGTTAAVIPAGAVAVTLNGGKGPVYYADGKEEKRAVGDWTLMKIYARSPLGTANYTQSIGVITSKKEGASSIYGDGYIFPDKLSGLASGGVASPPAPAPVPPPAQPVPPAPTVPSAQPTPPAMPDVVQQVTKCGPNEKCGPASDAPTHLSPVRRIARGINAFFSGIIRWFQHL